MSRIFSWDAKGVLLVCLCYVENATPAQIRHAIRRIRRRAPDVVTLVALLGNSAKTDGQDAIGDTELVQRSLRATVDMVFMIASGSSEPSGSVQPAMIAAAY